MLSYMGIEYSILAEPYGETEKYVAQFSLSHDKGYEVVNYPSLYLLRKGTDDLAQFNTQQEAEVAAEATAKNKIREILNL